MRTTARQRRAFLVLLTLALATAWLAAPTPAAQAEEPARVLLLLDVSGSMNEKISSGGTKFAAAKRALKQVADSLPSGTEVGLRVYGSEIAEPKKTEPRACKDTKLVMPVGPLDRKAMYRAVDSFRAVGETPIAYSLGKAADDLGDDGRRVVVLISDGEESCAGNPCPVARKLADKGVDLQFNAIGLDVGSRARKQLTCIADAGNGSYYDADQADDLAEALRKITQRALRPFAISGTPVNGAEDPESAPELTAGQYRDEFATDDVERYFRLPRRAGDTVTVSVNSLVPPRGIYNSDNWYVRLTTASGQSCDDVQFLAETGETTVVASGAVRSGDTTPACTSEQLILSVRRKAQDADAKRAAAEIRISAEPEIVNLGGLPDPIESYAPGGKAVSPAPSVSRAVGGSSFTNAPPLSAGAFTDAPAVGEIVFYRVPLDTGQRLRTTVTAPANRKTWNLTQYDTVTVATTLYTPSRVPLTKQRKVLQGANRVKITAGSPQVRVRNREIVHSSFVGTEGDPRSNASYASVAGDYYVSVEVRASNKQLSGQVLPIRLDLAVDGKPAGQPQYAADASTPTPSTPETPSSQPSSGPATASAQPTNPPVPPGESGIGPVALGFAAVVGAAVATVAGLAIARLRRPKQS